MANHKGMTPLMAAEKEGHKEIAEMLRASLRESGAVEAKADKAQTGGRSALRRAADLYFLCVANS